MPGLLARLSAALVSLTWYGRYTGVMPAGHCQAWYQVFQISVTLGMADGWGIWRQQDMVR